MSFPTHLKSFQFPRIKKRRTLIISAVALQAIVVFGAWIFTFRVVRDSFSRVVEDKIIEQNVELTERVAALLPSDIPAGVMQGDEHWEQLQSVIESLTDLPGEGFACIVEPGGEILCHPDIRTDPTLRFANLGDKEIKVGREDRERSVKVSDVGMEVASGRIEFVADGTHYVATRKLPNSDLRLLVHQPQRGLFAAARETTGPITVIAGVAAGVVVLVSGGGLFLIVRSYDSVFAEVNRRLEGSLQIARRIQNSTLPERLPELPGFALGAWSESAEETGGDTYDAVGYARLESGAIEVIDDGAPLGGFLLADATGHGIGPALSVTQVRSMLRMALRLGGDMISVIRQLNDQLARDLPSGRFITAWIALLDTESAELHSFSAGQGPILHFRAATGRVERLEPETFPLGIMDDLGVVEPRVIHLARGDIVAAISDGIFEAARRNGQGAEQFGIERTAEIIAGARHQSPQDIAERIRNSVDDFTDGAPADDDRTVVIIKRSA